MENTENGLDKIQAQIEINVNDYLSEEDKKELVIEVFKEQVKRELFKSSDGTIQAGSEVQRIIGNISHEIVMAEVQKYIPDCEKMIKDKTMECLNAKSFSYYVFKKKDAWERDESLAITYMNEAIRESKEVFKNRIKEAIAKYDLSKDIAAEISNTVGEMADTIYKLSELFHNK